MQVAVYAVECESSWRVWISLDLVVDKLWWSGYAFESLAWRSVNPDRIVFLASALPLGWAVKLREGFRWVNAMKIWGAKEWEDYIRILLKHELSVEREVGGGSVEQRLGDDISIWLPTEDRGATSGWNGDNFIKIFKMRDEVEDVGTDRGGDVNKYVDKYRDSYANVYGHKYIEKYRERYVDEFVEKYEGSKHQHVGDLNTLGLETNQLVKAVAGRSLLQTEIEALLVEQLPELLGRWRQAAQLAYLQGRLDISAAVGRAAGAQGGMEERAGKGSWGGRGARKESGRGKEILSGREVQKQYVSGREAREDIVSGRGVRKESGSERETLEQYVSVRGVRKVGASEMKLRYVSELGAWARQLPAGAGALARAAAKLPHLLWRGATRRHATSRCLRCGSVPTGRTACAACGLAGCAYCEACLALGRSRACALLLRSAALPAVRCTADLDPTAAAGRWGLSAAQAGAAGAALRFLAEPRRRSAVTGPERFLLWAVTGAGKTEMLFPLLEAVLAAGGRALVATPRRDVVLELAPRLAKAFPAENIAVLYGGSPDRWVQGRLTLATTHQLMRFHQGFDLVIIDELDAFPYHNDPMLAYAAGQACKPDGSFIYLSATPPQEMQRQARSGRLPHARVPVRFHGHPLPMPKHLTMVPVQVCLKRGTVPSSLIQALQQSLTREAQVFLFVSRIAHIEGLIALLRRSFPSVIIEGTSSKDPARAAKVIAFRNREISVLVTTTILERGVTVPRSDVFILDADSSLFDEASLVQMAGRAGRSKDDPTGSVIFASPQWSRSQRAAISQIRTMNTIARREGYIRKGNSL